MVELLAPAGSPEAVTAAVQSGANAVYLSFEDLTGCRRTENIPNSEFESVVRYCRIRGCRAYLALNIPVREDELNKAAGLALRAQRCGVDAIIVDPVDSASTPQLTKMAQQAKMPLVYVNRTPGDKTLPPGVVFVGSDERESGTLQMEALAKLANYKGNVAIMIGNMFGLIAISVGLEIVSSR